MSSPLDHADTYTREELLAALALRPCHITGMHTPEHHRAFRSPYDGSERDGFVCQDMRVDAFKRLLALLGVAEDELPRELHADCRWCRYDSKTETANVAWTEHRA